MILQIKPRPRGGFQTSIRNYFSQRGQRETFLLHRSSVPWPQMINDRKKKKEKNFSDFGWLAEKEKYLFSRKNDIIGARERELKEKKKLEKCMGKSGCFGMQAERKG